jgi:hypothetical protein
MWEHRWARSCARRRWRRDPVTLQLTELAAKALDVAGRVKSRGICRENQGKLALTALSDRRMALGSPDFGASAQHTIRERRMSIGRDQHAASPAGKSRGTLTRRSLMWGGAGIAAATTFPRAARPASEEVSPVMAKLSTYMSEAGGRALPDQVVQETKYHVLDTLAAMVSGSELPPGRQALKFARAYGGERIATIVASDMLGGPIEAAIVNGALAQSDETDDNYSAGGAHPGCAVIPAALAVGETFGIDGLRFLRAVTLGYDVGMRAMKTVLGGTVLRDTHNVVGTFGASAAAGCVANLNAEQMRWLLDYASQQAGAGFGAWQRDTEHTEKAFVFGSMGARNGVTAALLIQSGWTGVSDVFFGHENFFQSYAPQSKPEGLIDQLGERYEVTQTIIKKWSTGGPIQSPLDALVNLRKQHPFEADQASILGVAFQTIFPSKFTYRMASPASSNSRRILAISSAFVDPVFSFFIC